MNLFHLVTSRLRAKATTAQRSESIVHAPPLMLTLARQAILDARHRKQAAWEEAEIQRVYDSLLPDVTASIADTNQAYSSGCYGTSITLTVTKDIFDHLRYDIDFFDPDTLASITSDEIRESVCDRIRQLTGYPTSILTFNSGTNAHDILTGRRKIKIFFKF
jgi:hypothetical protein